MRLDLLDYGKKIIVLLSLPLFVIPSEWALADCEVVALRFEQEAWLVNAPSGNQ